MTAADVVLSSPSPTQTKALAAALAGLVEPGDVIVLAGELGAGKTAFTQGFGAALGITERITSPTITIAQRHDGGRLPLHHLDAYRLERLGEVADLALGELLDEGGVLVVEWGDVVLPALPPDVLEIAITFGDGDDDRVLTVRPLGPSWTRRWGDVQKALTSC